MNCTKRYLNENNLIAVSSDKTNRFVVTSEDKHIDKTRNLLLDTSNYRMINQSKSKQIEAQANKLIDSFCKNSYSKNQIERLKSCGTRPASFKTFIKDHKEPDENGFPLRPIASTVNSPTKKVDWLITQILNQLAKLVPSSLSSTESLIDVFKNFKSVNLNDKQFISLDVKNLYPSIPISYGIECVVKFAEDNWDKINSFGLSINNLKKGISFIAYNYEIEFDNVTYLQTKGCAMGSHYGPPFAIITVHFIETEALKRLRILGIKPPIYYRYIDDIIMGPFEHDMSIYNKILNCFNSINDNIQFTIEVPENNTLNFLDISIFITDNKICYAWYSKPTHSEITLHKDSWLPQHVKNNYVYTSTSRISSRCSSSPLKQKSIYKFKNRLRKNNYSNRDLKPRIKCKPRNNRYNENNVKFSINFINDSCNRKLNRLINKYKLPVTLISKPNKTTSQYFSRKTNYKHSNCELCDTIDCNYPCDVRFVVYEFKCNYCSKSYIGQTNRPFRIRYEEHKRSLALRNKTSALAEHSKNEHSDRLTISDFSVHFLAKHKSPLENRLAEARFISENRPELNRKHELVA